MADRTVTANLALNTAGYTPAAEAASKTTTGLAAAQRDAAAAASEAGAAMDAASGAVAGSAEAASTAAVSASALAAAQRDSSAAAKEAAASAKDAAATQTAALKAVTAAQAEATAAAKEAAAAETASASAVTDDEKAAAAAAEDAAAARVSAASETVASAKADADAAVEATTSAKAYAAAQRDAATASAQAAAAQKASADILAEVGAAEAAEAKVSEDAAESRTAAYGKAGTAITVMAAGFGLAAGVMVKAAGDFNSSTQHLVTDAGESQSNLAMVQAGILSTAAATGTSASDLTDAMYHIESAGYHGAAGLTMLTTAAEGAKVGNADLATVAQTLSGTMNSYNMTGAQSVSVMNELIAIVGAGDMKMNDLAGSLGNVTPKAAAAGISLAQVGGAIATMTAQNMSADQATQDLSNTISALQKPSSIAVQQMQQLGLNSTDVSTNLGSRGLTGTLELLTTAIANHTQGGQVFVDSLNASENAAANANTMLQQLPASIQGLSKGLLDGSVSAAEYKKGISDLDAPQQHLATQFETLVKNSGSFSAQLKGNTPEAETFQAALSNLLGGTTGLNTALMLTGGRMTTFQENVATAQAAADKGGTSVDNWAQIQGTFNQKIDTAKASLGALGIAIGTTLLPAVTELANWVSDIIKPIAEWVNQHQALTAIILGSVLALSGLALMIAAVVKGVALVQKAVEGVTTAFTFLSKGADEAAVSTAAMGDANVAAAAKTDAAAVSTGGFASKLGGAVPLIGAVALGAVTLGQKLGELAGVGDHTAISVTQLNTAMLGISSGNPQTVSSLASMGVALGKMGQMMGTNVQGLQDYDQSLAQLVTSGHASDAAAVIDKIRAATDANGTATINAAKDFPQYYAALDQVANTAKEAATATDSSTTALAGNTAAVTDSTDATGAATDATATLTAAQQAQQAADTQAAQQAQQHTAALMDQAIAVDAGAAATAASDVVTKSSTDTATASTKVTTANTTATNAQTAATKSASSASSDAGKAAADQIKASDDATKAAAASAAQQTIDASATATATEKKSAASAATSAAAAATRANTTATNADVTATDASSTASDKATKAAADKTKATNDAATAASSEAGAQETAAQSAADAAFEHEIGVTALKAWATAAGNTANSTDTLDTSVSAEVTQMKSAQTQAGNLSDALNALNGVNISAGQAAIDVQDKVAALTTAFRTNGTTLDITTVAGRNNMTAIYDLATAANSHAQAVTNETGSIKAGSDAMDASKAEFDAVLTKAGLSAAAIKNFNDTILQTPKMATIVVGVDNTAALKGINDVYAAASKVAHIQTAAGSGMATGGLITGAGTTTSDSIPIMASNKEFILNAAATDAIGVDNLTKWNSAYGGANVNTYVQPQLVTQVGGTTAQPAASGGTALNIENYYEAPSGNAQKTASELTWLLQSRGAVL